MGSEQGTAQNSLYGELSRTLAEPMSKSIISSATFFAEFADVFWCRTLQNPCRTPAEPLQNWFCKQYQYCRYVVLIMASALANVDRVAWWSDVSSHKHCA